MTETQDTDSTDELVEATAKAMVGFDWSLRSPKLQQVVRDQVRRGLESADPGTCRIARRIGGKA